MSTKNYLNFRLKGIRILPVWILFIVFFIVPFYFMLGEISELTAMEVPAEGTSKMFFVYLTIVLMMYFIFIFTFSKLIVRSIELKGIRLRYRYDAGKYVWMILSGLLFSIVTLGIFIPWLIKNIHGFFIQGITYHSQRFEFNGEGSKLFLIFTLTILIPFLIVGIVLFSILNSEINLWIYQLIVISILVSLIYLIFKWMVDIRYKDYLIRLDVGFFAAMWKIAIELVMAVIFVFIFQWLMMVSNVFLGENIILWDSPYFPVTAKIVIELVMIVITAGFYFPMAFIRLYRFFTAHTKSNVIDGRQVTIGYEGDQVEVFRFIWGQILLSVITLGIYFPWAFTRIVSKLFTQTFVETEVKI
ncbi:MAG: DUF898 family protein [Mariniphaga sp.]